LAKTNFPGGSLRWRRRHDCDGYALTCCFASFSYQFGRQSPFAAPFSRHHPLFQQTAAVDKTVRHSPDGPSPSPPFGRCFGDLPRTASSGGCLAWPLGGPTGAQRFG
jgi:hypothetical protein